ncbi:MAG: type II secretion system protein [Deltaproteobacteria bacterium]|nr:type II secretion system protein [Deltaproteobacteria bacterium]
MPKKNYFSLSNGFSLIELMVVVAILSVAAAIAVPKFLKYQVERRQEECHQNLRSLLETERNYFKKTNLFTSDVSALGWEPKGRKWHTYHFIPNPPPKNGFLFECLGNIDKDPTIDQATIDETGQINQISDDVKK